MPVIRPVSDLRNKYAEVEQDITATGRPIFFTKNGRGSMVLMSVEAYEGLVFENEIRRKLAEAEAEAKRTNVRFTHEEVFANLR